MTPNYNKAAIAAAETLIKYNISSAPVTPLPILKKIPNTLVFSFSEMSAEVNQERCDLINLFHDSQDAFTSVSIRDGKPLYVVAYNQQLPLHIVQRALSRELGHIVLGHDGSRPEDVRHEEAKAFANHLLVPRALIHALQALNIRITKETIGNLTGCYDHCLACLRKIPPVSVPAELNRAVRDQFMPYIVNYFNFQRICSHSDGSALADFGSFMEGYDE